MKISDACSTFVDEEAVLRNLRRATVEGYQSIFRLLVQWSNAKDLTLLTDLDEEQFRAWMRSWTCQPSTARRRLTQLKTFYRVAVDRGWVARSPLAKVRPPKSDSPPTMPLTIDEMRSLLTASAGRPRERGLLLLMRYSGLAIRDAATLRRDALTGTELTLRRAKSGELVMVALPQVVVEAITPLRGRNDQHFWWTGTGSGATTAKYWRTRLNDIADRAGVVGFHPHRLRDTFAVELLNAGVSMEDVSALLGHSDVATTERYYAPWDRRRRERLNRIVREANRQDPLLAELTNQTEREEPVTRSLPGTPANPIQKDEHGLRLG